MTTEVALLIGAVAGSVLTCGFTILNNKINKKSEELRHRREIALKLTVEEYKESFAEARRQSKGSMPPISIYFVAATKVLFEVNFLKSPKEIAQQLYKIAREAEELIDEYTKLSSDQEQKQNLV